MNALAAALEHHQAGRPDAAEPLYVEALAADPCDPTALYLYGLFNFEAGRAERACELLQTVVDLRPDHAEAQATLAGVRHWRGEFARAVDAYRCAVQIAPNHAGALVGLANALRELGDAAAARAAAEDAVRRHPALVEAHMALGAVRQAEGHADSAVEAFESAVAANPAQVGPRQSLALALMDAGRPEAALASADRALELDPTSPDAWFARGAALIALHRPAEAVMALDCSAAIEPSRAATQLSLGNAHAELDHADRAADCLKRALALDPASKEAHASLASVYLMAGKEAAAERHARLALALDPDMVVAHQNLASILAGQGRDEEAKRHRDVAYGGRCLFIDRTPGALCTVLVVATSESGNVPLRLLLPTTRFDRLRWVIEYAREGDVLPSYDVVFNAVGDPDLAEPTRAPMAQFMRGGRRPVLNDPAKVAETRRDRTAAHLGDIPGVVTPRTLRLGGEAMLAAEIDFPALIRPIGAHGGQGLLLAREPADLCDVDPCRDYYLTQFHDA
ncbi:MAG TPA: tetratricopeptide repeat protein, partial [Caulobacteraceae bacterium]|nr:tetratricopeptide repeat protein [Caulobacteraceae bacterium]